MNVSNFIQDLFFFPLYKEIVIIFQMKIIFFQHFWEINFIFVIKNIEQTKWSVVIPISDG